MIYGNSIDLGGGGGQMYNITLPRAHYYHTAAAWEKVGGLTVPSTSAQQIVAGGYLWIFTGTKIWQVSLTDGSTVWSTTASGGPSIAGGASSSVPTLATDGTMIYIGVGAKSLYIFNTINKTMTKTTELSNTGGCSAMCFSKKHNALFGFGGYASSSATTSNRAWRYDLDTGSRTALTVRPEKSAMGGAWADEETGKIYCWGNAASQGLYEYDPDADSYKLITDPDIPKTVNWVPVGDCVIGFYTGTTVRTMNPQTGGAYPGELPAMPTEYTTGYGHWVGVWENTLYTVQKSGLWKCELFAEAPADAPIVATIYEGQKFHALAPFKLPHHGITVTTQQQTADEDIVIRMYDYPAEGGQTLYITT